MKPQGPPPPRHDPAQHCAARTVSTKTIRTSFIYQYVGIPYSLTNFTKTKVPHEKQNIVTFIHSYAKLDFDNKLDSNLVYFFCNPTGVLLLFLFCNLFFVILYLFVFLPVKSINEMK